MAPTEATPRARRRRLRGLAVATVAMLAPGLTAQPEAAPIEVIGRAVDPLGRPLAGAALRLARAGDLTAGEIQQRTGPDGGFAVEVPRVGLDDLDLTDVPVLFLEARGRASVALTIWDRGRPRLHLGAITLFGGVTLRGRVHDPDGSPVAGARVAAFATRPTNPFHAGWVGWERLAMPHQDPARELAVAVVDAEGSFTLRGVPPLGASLQVTADGWSTWRSGPLFAGPPIAATLVPLGFARGVVVDAAGEPAAARVLLLDESGAGRVATTAADGAFAIPLATTSRHALLAVAPGRDPGELADALSAEAWRRGPADDLRVPLAGDAAQPRRSLLAVRAVDAAGEPIPAARAAPLWGLRPERARGSVLHALAAFGQFEVAGPDGRIPVRRPRRGEGFAGVVLVTAPDRGIGVVPVQWQPFQRAAVLPVELPPAGALRGRVVDEDDGSPIAGAVVDALPVGWRPLPADLDSIGRTARTAADGGFTIEGLSPGRFALVVKAPGRPRVDGDAVRVRPGASADPIEVRVPRGATFAGRLTGAEFDFRTRVILTPIDEEMPPGPLVAALDRLPHNALRVADVTADGAFRIEGLDLGRYTLRLALPRFHRGPAPEPLPLADLRVSGDGLGVEVPAAAALPARLEGRVERVDAGTFQIPPGRLVVVAAPHDPAAALPGGQLTDLGTDAGPLEPLAPSGEFAFRLPAGRWQLRVIDAVTGAVVASSQPQALPPGTRREVRMPLRLARLHVRLTPAADDPFVGQWLSIESDEPGPIVDEAVEAALRRATTRLERAIDIGPDRLEHDLLVAPGRIRIGVFGVRAGHDYSFAAVSDPDLAPLVEREMVVEGGEDVAVELRLGGPRNDR